MCWPLAGLPSVTCLVLSFIQQNFQPKTVEGPVWDQFIASVLFAKGFTLASTSNDLQCVLGWFAVRCEVTSVKTALPSLQQCFLTGNRLFALSGSVERSFLKLSSFSNPGACSQVRETKSIRWTGGSVQHRINPSW